MKPNEAILFVSLLPPIHVIFYNNIDLMRLCVHSVWRGVVWYDVVCSQLATSVVHILPLFTLPGAIGWALLCHMWGPLMLTCSEP
jgi:hypothetical protein